MNAWIALARICIALSMVATAGTVRGESADYPTGLRVEFVLECMRERDNPQYELIHKCSCVIDRFAREMNYDEFMEAWTTSKGVFIAGERGGALRDNKEAQKLARHFRESLIAAEVSCFLRSPQPEEGSGQ